jgi:hypothetical protein
MLEGIVLSVIHVGDYIMQCSRCQEQKSLEEMAVRNKAKGSYKTWCKKCASKETKEWREKQPLERLKKQQKKQYAKHKSRKITDDEYAIRVWCSNWRRRQGARFSSRLSIDIDYLVSLMKDAIKKYPYLHCRPSRSLWETPSVDRIDSSKPYSEDNIVVIPLWLNSAKLDMPLEKLHELMREYLSQE